MFRLTPWFMIFSLINKDFLIKNNDSCSRRFNRSAFVNSLIMHPPFSCIEVLNEAQ